MNLFISNAWAQAAGAATPAQPNPLGMFLPLIIVFGIFYFLIFRPQQKQQKLRKEMLANLKRGDEAICNGGIYGKVIEIADQTVMLQIANNVIVKVERSQLNVVPTVVVEPAKK
ncbi:MAG: hypothetical protein ACD_73C00659G0002 [uncultured bacterium]|nr:MAG: hypothetical protein ACD_73C00659G0002 [uncultured bacterium]